MKRSERTCFLVFAGLLFFILTAPQAVADSGATVQELSLYVDETIEVQTGRVDRFLNLDPELVKVTVEEPDAIVVKGLRYGTATVRVWGEAGALIVRIQVLGRRPSVRSGGDVPGRRGIDTEAFILNNRLRYFGYRTTGTADEWSDVVAYELEASLSRGDLSASGRTWLEERAGDVDIPHYDVLLDRVMEGPVGHAVLHAGTVEADWSQRTFSRKRLEGGRLELHSGQGPRRSSALGLEILYGKDVRDFVSLGSRTRVTSESDAQLGGGRIWWRPLVVLELEGQFGTRVEPGTGTRSVAALMAKSNMAAFGLESLLSYDGSRWAGRGIARWGASQTGVTLSGEYLDDGFATLRSGRGLAGARSLSASAYRNIGTALRLNASSAWRRWEPTEVDTGAALELAPARLDSEEASPYRDSWDHCVRASWRLSSHLLASGWWRLRDTEISAPHWRRLRGGGEISAHDFKISGRWGVRAAIKAGWENVNEKAGSPLDATYKWNALHLGSSLNLMDWLTIDGRIEGRFAPDDAPAEPGEVIWEASASGRLPPLGPVASGRVTTGYREWEHLNTTDGAFSTGRHVSAGLEIRTRTWHGLALEMHGAWSRNPDDDTDNLTIQLGCVSRLGFGERPYGVGAVYKGTIRGRIFHDENSNGLMDEGEPGLAGITVRLEDGREALTDEEGQYRFKGVKGVDALVRVVPERAEIQLAPTTPVVQKVPIDEADRVHADFGLGPRPAWLEVAVFNDLNENGVMEEGEPLVPDVMVSLKELGTQLRSGARETITYRLPIGQQVTCEWLPASLPDGYSPVDRIGQLAVLAEPGETIRWELPLKALRSISGIVFLDENGNGRRDPGEAPVEGVILQAGPRFAISDAHGRYTLKALAPGPVEVTIRESTIPGGWVLPEPLHLHLDPSPTALHDLTIAIRSSL
jgi:hypothetical protein